MLGYPFLHSFLKIGECFLCKDRMRVIQDRVRMLEDVEPQILTTWRVWEKEPDSKGKMKLVLNAESGYVRYVIIHMSS